MNSDVVLQLSSQLLWNAILISAPILGLTLLVGLTVSILQVVTQVQDMSLTFIPKVLSAVVALTVFGPWMLHKLLSYATNLISNIPSYF
ncbi:flagellar biosynthesis protein FliQ [Solimicrobium silvestre]|uniref:Flagellar biosynthetic protein FliQ n=1 Tax=Solimicrobium silvestre TaxID=2099400 RepID=A0A2S9H1Q5_9BURK|nr:flagellar biosynthesis protein FliQ [Solimicrobium silvestre]PRC93898.1 fliQ: flagellar biosynthetic protein FliQ [Solimicrobium silvestre]